MFSSDWLRVWTDALRQHHCLQLLLHKGLKGSRLPFISRRVLNSLSIDVLHRRNREQLFGLVLTHSWLMGLWVLPQDFWSLGHIFARVVLVELGWAHGQRFFTVRTFKLLCVALHLIEDVLRFVELLVRDLLTTALVFAQLLLRVATSRLVHVGDRGSDRSCDSTQCAELLSSSHCRILLN